MSEINKWSFLSVLIFQIIGVYAHWRKLIKTDRAAGTFFDYLFADHPGNSAATGIAIIGAAWLSTSSGASDLINPELVYTMLSKGILHVPSINGVIAALTAGYALDSMLNKSDGGIEK